MSQSSHNRDVAESLLLEILEKKPEDWSSRKKLAQLLYNEGKASYAADIIWAAPEIPSIDLELGFAVKVLSKGTPRRAIRLLATLQENNKDKPAQNLGIANALMTYGLVLQAARFYGAAVTANSSLANPDMEHFLLWVDDAEKIWRDSPQSKSDIGDLPWMKRDDKEAEELEQMMAGHTTPIRIPNLEKIDSEKIVHEIYEQSKELNAKITPPPAVTIPLKEVNPKDIIYDEKRGAREPITPVEAARPLVNDYPSHPNSRRPEPKAAPPVPDITPPTLELNPPPPPSLEGAPKKVLPPRVPMGTLDHQALKGASAAEKPRI